MQEGNDSKIRVGAAVELNLTRQRLARFSGPAPYHRDRAVEIYLWNCRLAQAFMFPLHICEVTTRNAIQGGLRVRFIKPWYEQETFKSLLDHRNRDDLERTVIEEKKLHRELLTDDHIVSSLTFGFWGHLTTKRLDRALWNRGTKHNFPNAFSKGLTIRDVSKQIQMVRQWRNRVMHHRALFDKEPERKLAGILTLIEWRCERTAAWVREHEQVSAVLAERSISAPGGDSSPPAKPQKT